MSRTIGTVGPDMVGEPRLRRFCTAALLARVFVCAVATVWFGLLGVLAAFAAVALGYDRLWAPAVIVATLAVVLLFCAWLTLRVVMAKAGAFLTGKHVLVRVSAGVLGVVFAVAVLAAGWFAIAAALAAVSAVSG